jgi:hypothetical protein
VPSDAALYYPRIRIQDPNWLKVTLLCFGKVRRMMPLLYTADDSDEVKECCQTQSPNGLLVEGASLWAEPVQLELMRLRKKIEDADEKAAHPFTREGYLENLLNPKLVDSFEIHRMKIEPLVKTPRNSYKFLNRVEQKANPHASWLTLPAFGKLA